jgi:hypothetical protein
MALSIVNATPSYWQYPNVTAETEEVFRSHISDTTSLPYMLSVCYPNSCMLRYPSHRTIRSSASKVIEICTAYRWLYYCKMQRLTTACQSFKWLSDEDSVTRTWPPSTECSPFFCRQPPARFAPNGARCFVSLFNWHGCASLTNWRPF